MQEHMYKSPIKDDSDLKQRLVEEWSAMPQCTNDEAINEWHKHVRCCVSAEGRHFKTLRGFPHITSINIAGSVVHLSDTVTTLGVNLDQTLNLQRHVNNLHTTTSVLSAISEPPYQMISV